VRQGQLSGGRFEGPSRPAPPGADGRLKPFSDQDSAGTAVVGCPEDAKKAPEVPDRDCDIETLTIQYNVIEAGSEEWVTLIASNKGLPPGRRPRDMPPPPNAPPRIRKLLQSYDMVAEVLCLESGMGLNPGDPMPMLEKPSAFKMRDRTSKQLPKNAAVMRATGEWVSSCTTDPKHKALQLWRSDALQCPDPARKIQLGIVCRKAMRTLFDVKGLYDVLRSLHDRRKFGVLYEVKGESHGFRKAKGASVVHDLNALVIGLPVGSLGVRVSIGPFFWDVQWGTHGADIDEKARHAREKVKYEEREAAVKELSGNTLEIWPNVHLKRESWRNANERDLKLLPESKRPSRVRNLAGQLKHAHLPKGLDEILEFVDLTFIVYDREIPIKDLIEKIDQVDELIFFLNNTLKVYKGACAIKNSFMAILTFIRKYAPSPAKPAFSVEIATCFIEGSMEIKTTFDSYDFEAAVGAPHPYLANYVLQGDRYRALATYLDAQVSIVLLDVSMSVGFAFGKILVGTGALLEAVATIGGKVWADAEPKVRVDQPEATIAGDCMARVSGEIRAKAMVVGQITFAWMELVGADLFCQGSIRARYSINLFDKNPKWVPGWSRDPLVGGVEARVFGEGLYRYDYIIWEGDSPSDEKPPRHYTPWEDRPGARGKGGGR
jgi:hypothetical protein